MVKLNLCILVAAIFIFQIIDGEEDSYSDAVEGVASLTKRLHKAQNGHTILGSHQNKTRHGNELRIQVLEQEKKLSDHKKIEECIEKHREISSEKTDLDVYMSCQEELDSENQVESEIEDRKATQLENPQNDEEEKKDAAHKELENEMDDHAKAFNHKQGVRHGHEKASKKDICHARLLKECSVPVIWQVIGANLHHKDKCALRQEFLYCMVERKKGHCSQNNGEYVYKKEIEATKRRVKNFFHSFGVCVRGVR